MAGGVFVALATVATLLAAAKAHGRQLRLEREARGYLEVTFRGDNPAWVEALWRQDRRRFWTSCTVLLAASLVLLFPRLSHAEGWLWLAFAVAWSFTACFVAMGIWSYARFARDRMGEPVWRRDVLLASAAWWTLVGALAAIIGLLLRFS